MHSRKPVGKALAELLRLAHEPKQGMWTGANDAYVMFHFVSGVFHMASKADQRRIAAFHGFLYQKYGYDNAFGWHKSLDNHTGDPRKSLALYYRELIAYFIGKECPPLSRRKRR